MLELIDYLKRKKRVSDMLISMHSTLRDEYHKKALLISSIVLAGSLWITALAFVSDQLSAHLSPFGISPKLWIGSLSIFVFFVSLLELKIDWNGKANSHQRAAEAYTNVKKRASELLAFDGPINDIEKLEFKNMVDFADTNTVPIPDNRFNELKQKHKIKVEISKHLDSNPGASILFFRIRLWFRDNINPVFGRKN